MTAIEVILLLFVKMWLVVSVQFQFRIFLE